MILNDLYQFIFESTSQLFKFNGRLNVPLKAPGDNFDWINISIELLTWYYLVLFVY